MKPHSIGTWWVWLVCSTAIMSIWQSYTVVDALQYACGFTLAWWTIEVLKEWWRNRPRPPYGGVA